MTTSLDVAAGERTLFPVDQATQAALNVFEGDVDGRVLVRLDDPAVTYSDEWSEATDLLTGLAVAVRRADCGAGCKCAAEVKLVRRPSKSKVKLGKKERALLHYALSLADEALDDRLECARKYPGEYDRKDVKRMKRDGEAIARLRERIPA